MNNKMRAKINAELEEDLQIEDDYAFSMKILERIENDKEGYRFFAKDILRKLKSDIGYELKDNKRYIRSYLFYRYIEFFYPIFGYQPYFDILDDFGDNTYFEKKILECLKEEVKRIKKESSYEDIRLIYEIREEIFNMVENRQEKYKHDIHMLELELKGISFSNERNKPLTNQEMEDRVLEKVKVLEQRKLKRNEKGTEL